MSEVTGRRNGSGAVPVVPDYGGACIASLVGALTAPDSLDPPAWLPLAGTTSRSKVLLVVDGLGWDRLGRSLDRLPNLRAGVGGPITSVAPTTTATALTSISTGSAPSQHGIFGYRMGWPDPGSSTAVGVFNVLRWSADNRDMREAAPAEVVQPLPTFGGAAMPVVTREGYESTGFSAAHLKRCRIVGWQVPSTLVVAVAEFVEEGESLVYAYYDGVDKVAHRFGLGDYLEQELLHVDHLVGELLAVLPSGTALFLTADHGQVEVREPARLPSADLLSMVRLVSGEGRFRWYHAVDGASDDLLNAAREDHGADAWVMARREVVEAGWFGGPVPSRWEHRLGDVAVVAKRDVAFFDPADTGETRLVGRHGSLTREEMMVPLLAWQC